MQIDHARHPRPQPVRKGGRPLGGGEVVDGDVDLGAARAFGLISSSRAIALDAVRTFSRSSIRPPSSCSSGFTASAEPNSACAAPIRPPRRR